MKGDSFQYYRFDIPGAVFFKGDRVDFTGSSNETKICAIYCKMVERAMSNLRS